jgi:hypothetical protein
VTNQNATALIRFLPSKNLEDIPFVRIYKHNFKDATTGRWYIENSLTTIGGQDMVSTVNKELWESGGEGSEARKLASLRKRKTTFIANILVIKDLGNPENNGKVMKYEFGQKIWEKIVAAAKPSEELGEEAISAFDPINGADFSLKMTYNEATDQYSYDSSKFNSKKPLFGGDDDKIEEVLNQCYDIQLEIAPDKFKTEAELADKFLWVTGKKDNGAKKAANKAQQEDFDAGDAELAELSKMVQKQPEKKALPKVVDNSSDDDSEFFKSLIED